MFAHLAAIFHDPAGVEPPAMEHVDPALLPEDFRSMQQNFEEHREDTDPSYAELASLVPGQSVPYALAPQRTIELVQSHLRPMPLHPSEMYTLEVPPPPHELGAMMLPPPPIDGEPFGFGAPFFVEMGPDGPYPPQPVFLHHSPMGFHPGLPPPPPGHFNGFPDGGMPSPGWMTGGPLSGAIDMNTGAFYMNHEHPRLRTPQACEKCRARKAKVSVHGGYSFITR
jgi:hypothetical protein